MAAIVPPHEREICSACVTRHWSCLAAVKYQKRAKGQLMDRVLRLSFSSLLLMSQMFIWFDGSTRWHCVREQRWFTVQQKKAEDSAESISRQQMQIHLMRAGCQGTESKEEIFCSFVVFCLHVPDLSIFKMHPSLISTLLDCFYFSVLIAQGHPVHHLHSRTT